MIISRLPHSWAACQHDLVKIARVTATPVNVTLDTPYYWSQGTFPGFSKTIVQVETDDGIVGLGEAPSHKAASTINDHMAELITGLDPIDIAALELRCLPSWRGVQSIFDLALVAAFGAIEMALWDIRGKLWNRPIYDLLGGAVRRQVPFVDYFAYRMETNGVGGEMSVEAVAEYCQALHDTYGTTYFEGKVCDTDLHEAIRLVATLRERFGPHAMIRIDSNRAYSLAAARQLARPFEELWVRNWEDPVGTFEEMAVLRQGTSMPFSSHNMDFGKAVSLGVPDAFVTDVASHGGFGRLIRFIGACEAHGIDYWCYSGDTGVGTAAYLHICAAMQWIREPNNSILRMQPFDVIEEGPFSPRNNMLDVPAGPGLGVTLSADKLAYAHRLFLDNGPLNKNADPGAAGRNKRLPLV
jgi:glucarate dehydratase